MRGLEGNYMLIFDMEISSEGSYDTGLVKFSTSNATINKNTSGLNYSVSGQGLGLQKGKTIEFTGGSMYYLMIAYQKDGSGNYGTDTFTVKNIRVCQLSNETEYTFNFVETNGKYVSNNNTKGSIDTFATSYIPVNLEGLEGKFDITVNAELVGTENIGEIGVGTSNTTYLSNIAKIEEATEAQDYTITVTGGQDMYLTLNTQINLEQEQEIIIYKLIVLVLH